MQYWIYENIVHNTVRVHSSACPFCKDGRGLHEVGLTGTGNWSGPFESLDEACAKARSCEKEDQRLCLTCLGEIQSNELNLPNQKVTSDIDQQNEVDGGWVWERAEELSCSLRLKWRPLGKIELDDKSKLQFPIAPSAPGIYRIRCRSKTDAEAVYVGESDNLRRRFGNYRNAGKSQKTNIRLNELLTKQLEQGSEISLSIIDADAWISTSHGEAKADLSCKPLRRLFENLSVAVEQATEADSLNL